MGAKRYYRRSLRREGEDGGGGIRGVELYSAYIGREFEFRPDIT
jgi:hypothetical protein